MALPTKITNHTAQALALLTDAYKNRANVEGILKALVSPKQTLENAVWDCINGHLLPNAVGVQLDTLGAIVGEARNGRLDPAYRVAISVRIRVNRSDGRSTDMIDVALLLDTTAKYTEYYPFEWLVEIYNTADSPEMVSFFDRTRALTSYGVLLTSDHAAVNVMRWDDSIGSVGATAQWDWTDGSLGHKWAAALAAPYTSYA